MRQGIKLLSGVLLVLGVFLVDLYTPLGIPDGMSYILIVILTIWSENKRHTIAVACVSVVLTVTGYYFSPRPLGDIQNIAIINRVLSVLFIVVSAFLILKFKHVQEIVENQRKNLERLSHELKETNGHLEEQVKARTEVLQEALNELEYSKQELSTALEHEKELNVLKTRIVSMASHEFRTPLATILSSLSLISKYSELQDSENQHKHIVRIRSAISHLTDLVEDTMSVSRLQEGEMDFIGEKLDVNILVSEVVEKMQLLTKEDQTIEYSHTGSAEIVNDRSVLKRITGNLISNAIKFSNEGTRISITTQTGHDSFILIIKDQGIGIPEREQGRLFERFFRAENAFNIQGTGLGLCIVAKYVELMNGTIEVESKENAGSTFMVRLPVISSINNEYAIAS